MHKLTPCAAASEGHELLFNLFECDAPELPAECHAGSAQFFDLASDDDEVFDDIDCCCDDDDEVYDELPMYKHTVTVQKSDCMSIAVHKAFAVGAFCLLALALLLALVDPHSEGYPFIGCSWGFTALHGYEKVVVVGLNSRLFVEPKLSDQGLGRHYQCVILQSVFPEAASDSALLGRHLTQLDKDMASMLGQEFVVSSSMRRHGIDSCSDDDDQVYDELPSYKHIEIETVRKSDCMSIAVHKTFKDSTVFKTMLLMIVIDLGDFEDEQSYIVNLQSELPEAASDSATLGRHLTQLDKSMASMLGQEFVVSSSMRRQGIDSCSDDDDKVYDELPVHKHAEIETVQKSDCMSIAVHKTFKDSTVFKTVLLMIVIDLGDFEDEQSYIVNLQSVFPEAASDSATLGRHLTQLDKNMASMLGQEFVVSGSMRRQGIDSCSDDDDQVHDELPFTSIQRTHLTMQRSDK